jgi:hypothetical protein
MTAADTNLSSESARPRFSVFMRAGHARLAAGALVAWGEAWAVVMVAPLRDLLFVMRGETVSAITLAGMGAIAAPIVLWAIAPVAAFATRESGTPPTDRALSRLELRQG